MRRVFTAQLSMDFNATSGAFIVPLILPRGYVITSVDVLTLLNGAGSVAGTLTLSSKGGIGVGDVPIITAAVAPFIAAGASYTLTPGSPLTVGALQYELSVTSASHGSTAERIILGVTVHGTIPGPR